MSAQMRKIRASHAAAGEGGGRPAEVLNITDVRQNLLRLVGQLEAGSPVLVSRNDTPVAALVSLDVYEYLCGGIRSVGSAHPPALIVLGARRCEPRSAFASIRSINRAARMRPAPFSKIIFVHSRDTRHHAAQFHFSDVRLVLNEKAGQPLISSVKCGLAALSPGDTHFMLALLSASVPAGYFATLSRKSQDVKPGIVVLHEDGRPIHPIAFSARYKRYFIGTRKELGIPYLMRRFRNDILPVDVARRGRR